MIELHFLGTGTSSGVPMIGCNCAVCKSDDKKDNRLRSSVLISSKNTNVLIDAGPDLRQQLLNTQPSTIDGIVFSHEHRDHTAGLDDIRPYYFKQKKAINLFGNEDVKNALLRDYHYAFGENRYPGAPSFDYNTLQDFVRFKIKDIELQALPVQHGSIKILGYLINNKIAYITDASALTQATLDAIEGIDLLIINALRIEKHHSHFNLEEAVALSQKVGAKQSYFTHISHLLGKYQDIQKTLPKNIALAYDGLVIGFE